MDTLTRTRVPRRYRAGRAQRARLPSATMLALLKRHPFLMGSFALFITAGAVIGLLYLPPDWAILRRLAAGGVAGGGIVLLVAGPKLFVS